MVPEKANFCLKHPEDFEEIEVRLEIEANTDQTRSRPTAAMKKETDVRT